MQRTKRGWLRASALLLALGAGIAHAQAPDGPPPGGAPPEDGGGPPPMRDSMNDRGPGAQRELKTLTRLLSLTSDQQAGVKTILEQQATQMRALLAKTRSNSEESNTPEARQSHMAQIEQIRDDADTKITALLNDSQKQTFAEWLAKRKAQTEKRREQDGGDGPPPPPPDGGGPPQGE